MERWPNGVWRCWVTMTAQAAYTTVNQKLMLFNVSDTYLGDGVSGIFCWGAQVELGAFVSSYIPTTSAQVTRSADVPFARGNADGALNAAEGTLYLQALLPFDTGAVSIAGGVSDGSTSNGAWLGVDGSTDKVTASLNSGGASQAALSSVATLTYGSTFKQALGYKVNDFAASLNAATPVTDAAGLQPANLTQIDIGAQVSATPFYGLVQTLAYFNSRRSNAELQAMTA